MFKNGKKSHVLRKAAHDSLKDARLTAKIRAELYLYSRTKRLLRCSPTGKHEHEDQLANPNRVEDDRP